MTELTILGSGRESPLGEEKHSAQHSHLSVRNRAQCGRERA